MVQNSGQVHEAFDEAPFHEAGCLAEKKSGWLSSGELLVEVLPLLGTLRNRMDEGGRRHGCLCKD